MDTISRVANGYAFDFLGGMNNDWYLWDFGAFIAVGPKEQPIKPITVLDQYHALLREDTDPDAFADRTPDVTLDVELVEYDYTMFLSVPLKNATHVVDPDTETPVEIGDEVTINGEDGVVLQSEDRRDTTKNAITKDALESRVNDKNWLPVVRLLN